MILQEQAMRIVDFHSFIRNKSEVNVKKSKKKASSLFCMNKKDAFLGFFSECGES